MKRARRGDAPPRRVCKTRDTKMLLDKQQAVNASLSETAQLLACCALNAGTLCVLARGEADANNAQQARLVFGGGTDLPAENCLAVGFVQQWQALTLLQTADYRHTMAWRIAEVVAEILAAARPERGWLTAWRTARPRLANINDAEHDDKAILAELRETEAILNGTVPLLPSICPVVGSTTETPHTEGEGIRPRGRARKTDWNRDAKIAAEWEKARDAGVSKKEFAREKSLTTKELNRTLNRHAKRVNARK